MTEPAAPSEAADPLAEFDRQLGILIDKGYPDLADLTAEAFTALAAPARAATAESFGNHTLPPIAAGRYPLVLVTDLVPAHEAMPLTSLHAAPRARSAPKPGTVTMFSPAELAEFCPVAAASPPAAPFYVITDVERGEEFCGVRPEDATAVIYSRGRSPLTVTEGIALITAFPEALEKNKCFSLAGSRSSSQRVPALWISERAPKLGWCWDRNPHSWLGVASCGERLG